MKVEVLGKIRNDLILNKKGFLESGINIKF